MPQKISALPTLAGLSPSQTLAIAALLEGCSYIEAAERAGVDRRTIYTWRHEDTAFQEALEAERARAWTEHREQVEALRGKALAYLSRALDSVELDRAAVTAATAILDRAGLPATKEVRQVELAERDPELVDRSALELRAELRLVRERD